MYVIRFTVRASAWIFGQLKRGKKKKFLSVTVHYRKLNDRYWTGNGDNVYRDVAAGSGCLTANLI